LEFEFSFQGITDYMRAKIGKRVLSEGKMKTKHLGLKGFFGWSRPGDIRGSFLTPS